MKIKRIILFACVTLIFGICFVRMNNNFDCLSRYPYEDEEARALIDEYLDDDEIEYIIDYSIHPGYFIKYIKCPSFNIYHVDAYDEAYQYYWYCELNDVVDLVEEIYSYDNGETIDYYMSMIQVYDYHELSYYLYNIDEFNGLKLMTSPADFNPDTCSDGTISTYVPRNLETEGEITLEKEAFDSLNAALDEVNETFNCRNYGGIKVGDSYLSFDELKERNADPGRNIHQLGKAVDLDLENSRFLNNSDYVKMKEIFEKHGFSFGECSFSKYHLLYTGVKTCTE